MDPEKAVVPDQEGSIGEGAVRGQAWPACAIVNRGDGSFHRLTPCITMAPLPEG